MQVTSKRNRELFSEEKFGISETSIKLICDTLSTYDTVEKAKVFGSRAIGNAKRGSDIDIVLYGERLNDSIIHEIKIILNEKLTIPYFVDILNFHVIENNKLIEHIKQFGKLLYIKE